MDTKLALKTVIVCVAFALVLVVVPHSEKVVSEATIHHTTAAAQQFDQEAESISTDYVTAVSEALDAARKNPDDPAIVPLLGVPLFHDPEEVKELLVSVDSAVRQFVFVLNSNDEGVESVLRPLEKLKFGVTVYRFPHNVGFSGAVNTMLKQMLSDSEARWTFVVNADTVFPSGNLQKFGEEVNKVCLTHGLVYGPRQDHFAFVITKTAVETVGLLDEVFYPGYMEDIDYHWRVRLGGLQQVITGIHFHHKGNANRKKRNNGDYIHMLVRVGNGWEYGWQKWGFYTAEHLEWDHPPSRWRTPFNIKDAPLSLWAIDPNHRQCIKTGKGQYHIRSSTCWYNGTVLLDLLPSNVTLPDELLSPSASGKMRRFWNMVYEWLRKIAT